MWDTPRSFIGKLRVEAQTSDDTLTDELVVWKLL
jgi:hypothetical protein